MTHDDLWAWHRAMLIEAREAQDIELIKYHQDALARLNLERRGLAPHYTQRRLAAKAEARAITDRDREWQS